MTSSFDLRDLRDVLGSVLGQPGLFVPLLGVWSRIKEALPESDLHKVEIVEDTATISIVFPSVSIQCPIQSKEPMYRVREYDSEEEAISRYPADERIPCARGDSINIRIWRESLTVDASGEVKPGRHGSRDLQVSPVKSSAPSDILYSIFHAIGGIGLSMTLSWNTSSN
jgi:hypothetical protein